MVPVIGGCGAAAVMSQYGSTQNIDIHFTNRGEEVTRATCVIRSSVVNKSVTAPACAAVPSSFSTLLVKCDAPGVPTGYVDADFSGGYPQRLIVQAGMEKRYVYSLTNHTFHEVGVGTASINAVEPPPSSAHLMTKQFAGATGAAQRAADATRRVCDTGPVQ